MPKKCVAGIGGPVKLIEQRQRSVAGPAAHRLCTLVDNEPTPIAADKWQFDADGMSISLNPSGTKFEAGKLYNLVYQEKDPKVTGLGYAAVRNFAAFLRSDKNSPVPNVDKIFATCD